VEVARNEAVAARACGVYVACIRFFLLPRRIASAAGVFFSRQGGFAAIRAARTRLNPVCKWGKKPLRLNGRLYAGL
jgi:hypothetical protein